MSRTPRRLLDDVSRETFEQMKDDLRDLGANVPEGDDCIIEHRGALGRLRYLPSVQRVEIAILKKPLFVPDALVWSLLDRALNRYRREPHPDRPDA